MKNQTGFTLIEVIVTLILVGILASMAGMGIVSGVQGYLFAKDNAAISQKAQAAMARLNRTFTEVLDITTANPTRVTYKRLINDAKVEETLFLDDKDQTLRIADGGTMAGGDILVDNVASLKLSFKQGNDDWKTSDPFNLLSSITVELTQKRPDGGSDVSFTTAVTPRNNGNLGGEAPPSKPPLDKCFVATAAFGHANHPMVIVLKEFRDRYLLTWSGGRTLVRLYYDKGPLLADQIRGNAWACILTQALLMPFVGVAFLILHAVIAVPVVIGLFWAGMGFSPRFFSTGRRGVLALPRSQKGGVLIGLIVTMVIFGFIGAAMISLTNTSTFSQIGGHTSQKAYYLAEAGMRYAASEFLAATDEIAKDDVLEALNDETFTMGDDGEFRLKVFPYYFTTGTDPKGTKTLKAKFPGSVPAGISIPTTDGYLKIRNETAPRQYSSYTLNKSNITFTMVNTLPSYTENSNVLFVGQAKAGTLSRNANLTLSSGSGAFPLINGTFTIGTSASLKGSTNDVYVYESRSGDILENVRLSKDINENFPSLTVPANAFITSMKFVRLDSTGTFSQGTPLEATRNISYSLPIGWVSGEGDGKKAEFIDTFEDLSHWWTGSGEAGKHEIKTVDGSKALAVTGTSSPAWDLFGWYERASLLTLNWGSTEADLNQSWALSDYLLSYDTQVKIRVNGQNYYMAGLVFRVDTGGNMYGVSFLRANRGVGFLGIDNDRIPDEFCPAVSGPMIVLWQDTSSGRKWLAYKELSTTDGVVDSNGRLIDWSTLLVRVIEADTLEFDTGKAEFRYRDTVTGALSGATAKVNGTPILTSGTWAGGDAKGWLTVTNVTKNGTIIKFVSGENLLVNGVAARYTGSSRQKDNYIRVYFGNLLANGSGGNTNPLDRHRNKNSRITTTRELNWPVDDVSDWDSTNDAFTLVQWNDDMQLDAGNARLGKGRELNAVIRTNALTTPDTGLFTRPEVGLDTFGSSSTSVYFDDFGIQTPAPGQTQGFLPGIQQ